MGWMDDLKPVGEFPALGFGDGGGGAGATTTNVVAGLPSDLKHRSRQTRRAFLHLLHVANAARHLERLPRKGEAFHCVMRGDYNAWDLVPAVERLAAPSKIDELCIATLGFSTGNANELLEMLDARRIGRVWFLCSHYFKGTSQDIYNPLAEGLTARGQKILAMRSHAKVLLFALSDRRRLVVESSANLRSCKNIEQFTMTHDAKLHAFHRKWITEMFTHERATA